MYLAILDKNGWLQYSLNIGAAGVIKRIIEGLKLGRVNRMVNMYASRDKEKERKSGEGAGRVVMTVWWGA